MSEESFGTKFDEAVREIAADQAAAYSKYASLLGQFAKKEVDLLSFGRNTLDIYADALRDVTQVGGRITNDTVRIGISKVKSLRLVKTAAESSSSLPPSPVAATVEAVVDTAAKGTAASRKKPS